MFKSVVLFGLIGGLLAATSTLLITSIGDATQPTIFSQLLKFLTMAAVLYMCLYGIKRVRDNMPDKKLSFPQGVVVGFGISALASLIHCTSWELYYFSNDYQFAREVSQNLIQKAKLNGANAIEVAELMVRNGKIVEAYANPVLRITMAYLQMFVIGAIVSCVGAVLIRNPNFWVAPHKKKEATER